MSHGVTPNVILRFGEFQLSQDIGCTCVHSSRQGSNQDLVYIQIFNVIMVEISSFIFGAIIVIRSPGTNLINSSYLRPNFSRQLNNCFPSVWDATRLKGGHDWMNVWENVSPFGKTHQTEKGVELNNFIHKLFLLCWHELDWFLFFEDIEFEHRPTILTRTPVTNLIILSYLWQFFCKCVC